MHTAELAKMTKPAVVHPGKILPGKLLFSLSIYRVSHSNQTNQSDHDHTQTRVSLAKHSTDQLLVETPSLDDGHRRMTHVHFGGYRSFLVASCPSSRPSESLGPLCSE